MPCTAVKVISFDHLELEERNEKSDETLGGGYLYLGEISSPLMPTALRCWEISGLKGCRTSSFGLLLGPQFRGPFFLIVFLCADTVLTKKGDGGWNKKNIKVKVKSHR